MSGGADTAYLLHDLLPRVSRSFGVTLRWLPRGMSEPVGLAYLLARLSDTVADAGELDAGGRIAGMRRIREAVLDPSAILPATLLEGRSADDAEAELVARFGDLIALLRRQPPGDAEWIRWVLERIIDGQTGDIERFGGARGLVALEDAEALEGYAYAVAGCVGEFWTRIGFLHDNRFADRPEYEMVRLGVDYGKGLQLVNILRDFPDDLADGRCYLPEDALGGHGVSPGELASRPQRARAVHAEWRNRALGYLESGIDYACSLRACRMRAASLLPALLGCDTLSLLRGGVPECRVKIPRALMRCRMSGVILRAPFRSLLRGYARRCYRAASGSNMR